MVPHDVGDLFSPIYKKPKSMGTPIDSRKPIQTISRFSTESMFDVQR